MDKYQLEHVNCNYCGSNSYSIVYEARYEKEKVPDLKEKFKSSGDENLIDQVVKCNNCGLIFINPRLKSDFIIQGYSKGSDENFVSQAKGRELTFEKSLKLIEKYSKKGKILDIGTAGGSFLHVAKKRGWEVYGIEPNKWLCEWSKKNYGLDIKPGTLSDYKFEDNYFDVVTLWDVLEHVPDPKALLSEINNILKKDGLLIVNYPDIGSLVSKIMGRKWVFLLSVHLFYFNQETIKKMLGSTNFKICLTKKHFQKLALGYLIFRMHAYSKIIHKMMSKIVRFSKTENIQIPYWLGQTLVLAKKR